MTNKLIGVIIAVIIIYTLLNSPTTGQFPSQLKTYEVVLPNIVKIGFVLFGKDSHAIPLLS